MRTRLTRQPGQPGTKQLVAEYGAKLVPAIGMMKPEDAASKRSS
jgi:hypothetical protein